MFTKKNIFAVAIFLATVSFVQANDTSEETSVDTVKQLTEQEQSLITTIISHVVDSALETIVDKIETPQTQAICLQDAINLLQSQANNLVDGSIFELNGTNYTVHTHKTMEIIQAHTQTSDNN